MLFCGIDLHSNNSVVVISDENDKVLYSKRHPNNLDEIRQALSPYQPELLGIVVESTFNWYWLVDGLQEAGYPVHLANTTAIKQYDGLKYRSDESDARHLAHVLRLGLLPEGHIMPKAMLGVRDLARKRMQLVQQRTTQIDTIETELARYCRSHPAFSLLKSVTGIGDVLATVILLETGSIDRFADVGNYASYCRCVGSLHESNGKKKGAGNTKSGNRYLARAFVETANFAIRYCKAAKKFYQRKKTKRNAVVAIKAVAHKLARACFHMLKTGELFSVERCFTSSLATLSEPDIGVGVTATRPDWTLSVCHHEAFAGNGSSGLRATRGWNRFR